MSTKNGASKGLNVALWVVQVLLALAFGMAGSMKLSQPIEELHKAMAWTLAVPEPVIRFIGTAELAGAIGLLLPSLTRILPFLTPLAGVGLTTIMVLASGFHASRGEGGAIVINAVLGSLAAFIAWGRFRKAPISGRQATAAATA